MEYLSVCRYSRPVAGWYPLKQSLFYKGCLEKLGFSFKIKACAKIYHRHMADIPRTKF